VWLSKPSNQRATELSEQNGRKTDISAPDGEHSLLDDYFSELNDTLELLAFET
jgi:hypothetical protein